MADALIISRPLSKKGERENEGEREACGEIDDWALLPLRPSVRSVVRPSAMLMDATDARMSCFIVEVDLVDRARQAGSRVRPFYFSRVSSDVLYHTNLDGRQLL